jgi:glycosyltransferase involved in cell wall biosynthesis
VILQHRLLHYRVGLFERLRAECDRRGIELRLVHGQASAADAVRKDTGHVPWEDMVRNRWISIGRHTVLWQPYPRALKGADLVVLMQENKILSNYVHLVGRLLGGRRRVAYWGHGRNFMSAAPSGLRERWKTFWIDKVDWWFAYTNLTRKLLLQDGFPDDRITCLNNAVDDERFVADLAAVTPEDIAGIEAELDLAPGAPLGLYCGSLYPEKRVDVLADAARRIHAAIPSFRMVVLGDGPSRPALEAEFGGAPWARCVGPKSGAAKARYFRRASAILSPGVVGLHVLDAFWAGVPLFTLANRKHGPEVEYLEHGKNGFISDDEAGFADSIIQLLRDPEATARVAAAARASAAEYTVEAMVTRFADGIERCLSRPATQAEPALSRTPPQ